MSYRYLLIIPCLILIGLIITAGFRGLADVNVQSTRQSLVLWESDVNTLNNTEWTIAYDSVSKAVSQDPLNPELLTLMANVQEWKIYLDKDDEENNYYLGLALKNYRKAAELRPAWPYTWSQISFVKYRMGEIDQELQQAIENATNTGPWEPGVQQIIAEVGLGVWQELDFAMKKIIVRNIDRGITMQPILMLNILKKYGHLKMVCYQKKKDPAITKFCEKS
ncbi:MAG: hypothetical protein IIA99_03105 [Proteobacteria bacterium]|nr:hypothetical protein [Pseudomonadota bacterium]